MTGEIEPVPTAALAVIDLNLDEWPYIDEGRGTLRKLYRPKEEMSQR
ncbi:MAG: hypothetical protein IPG22_04250 [Acidobacteria bacterium]|nr:hypothetical protein [Acidobacteriota bacterium]